MDQYQHFIAISRYARWLDDEGRRETWEETVTRYMNFMSGQAIKYGYKLSKKEKVKFKKSKL